MDHPRRTLAKTITWQVTGFLSMLGIGYLATGTVSGAGGVAVTSTAMGTICYVLHERAWDRIAWGRRRAGSDKVNPASTTP